MKLTESQKKAIYSDADNILVNASAGSGKTSVFAARIVDLIKRRHVNPERILALTFSKDAAKNMCNRVASLAGESANDVTMVTFHSFAYKLLHQYFPKYYSNTQMMKNWWKMKQMFAIASKPNAMNPDGLKLSITAPQLAMFISYQKSNMVLKSMPVVIDENTGYADQTMRPELQKAYCTFMNLQKNARLIEYDDLLLHLYYRLYKGGRFIKNITDKYDYIMVDEFQDTSRINMEILKMISDGNLFVVGDFRQGIYGFINADIHNILNFSKTFKKTHVIELQENFRSTTKIVDLSNKLIESRKIDEYDQFKSAKSAIGVDGSNVHGLIYKDGNNEVNDIVSKIEKNVANGGRYDDYAILLRTNAQMGAYESEFATREIPIDVSNSHSFFERTEVDVLLGYLKVMLDHSDNQSMTRIVNNPNRYLSHQLLAQLDAYAFKHKTSVFKSLSEFSPIASKKQVGVLTNILTKFDDRLTDIPAKDVLEYVIRKTRFMDNIQKSSRTATDADMKSQSVSSLIGLSSGFNNIAELLVHIDIIRDNNKKAVKNSVKLMTIHASKGLEFNHVFIPSVSDDYFPHEMCNGNIEEEARLLYVAITRAKCELDLSYNVDGVKKGAAYSKPSRFLTPIYPNLLDKQKMLYKGAEIVEFD